MTDDRLIYFEPVVESVLNSTLNIVLPPNFIVTPMTKPTNHTIVLHGDDTKTNKRNKKWKTANGNDDNNCIATNNAPVKDFLLKGRGGLVARLCWEMHER